MAQLWLAVLNNPGSGVTLWEMGEPSKKAPSGPPTPLLSDEQMRSVALLISGKRFPRAQRGKTPSDRELIGAMVALAEEEDRRKYGAMVRAARQLHMDVSTLHRWRKRFTARFADGEKGHWREALDGVREVLGGEEKR